jgi:hypothetical protein
LDPRPPTKNRAYLGNSPASGHCPHLLEEIGPQMEGEREGGRQRENHKGRQKKSLKMQK